MIPFEKMIDWNWLQYICMVSRKFQLLFYVNDFI